MAEVRSNSSTGWLLKVLLNLIDRCIRDTVDKYPIRSQLLSQDFSMQIVYENSAVF